MIGSGTAGTFTGVARYFKDRIPKVLCYAVETQGSVLGGGQPGTQKWRELGRVLFPRILIRRFAMKS